MSILQYFQRKDGLPDPRGDLSANLPPRAIALANSEIQKSIHARPGVYEYFQYRTFPLCILKTDEKYPIYGTFVNYNVHVLWFLQILQMLFVKQT